MKRAYFAVASTILFFILTATLASGCAVVPELDTTNKRVYASELALSHALQELDRREQAGEYSPEEWDKIRGYLSDLRDIRAALYAASDSRETSTALEQVYEVLSALRPFLSEP